MKDYKISIVTPFHNVDIKMFRRACESMFNQTYGIDNIQWIIVVHNSDEEYLNAVNELVKGHESILVKVLNNDKRTPSSPRNYGMTFATGKYIGFLDGDDGFTPSCIETSLKHIESTNSQMLVFRREFELADKNCMPFTELTLWNQTREEIVIERGHFVNDIMFEGYWGFVTSRIYDREFLEKYNIRFSDDIPYAEDMHFCMLAYGHLDRVCYLPRFIGYHYYINGGSLVQSKGTKDGKTLVYFAEGFNKILATGLYYRIPINSIANGYIAHLMFFLMGSPDITVEQIRTIKEIMEPYARMAVPLKPTKIFSKPETEAMYGAVQMILNMSAEEIMQEKEKQNAGAHEDASAQTGINLLKKIIDDNVDTDIAKAGFSDIKSFRENVNVSTYDDYAPLIELTTKIGEKNIFTSYPILCYALTSGSMGQPKYIPCTDQHLEDFIAAFENIIGEKKSFVLFESLPHKILNDSAYLDTISGATLYYYAQKNGGGKVRELFTSPHELLFPQEVADTIHARLLFALLSRDVEQIVAPFTLGILEAFKYLESEWETLCNDIEAGKISKTSLLSDVLRDELNRYLTPNPERAKELRAIFSKGFDEPVATKIWPCLEKIIAAGTGSFAIYTDKLRRYTGNITHSNGIYASSEALIGIAADDNSDRYIMQETNCFPEFMEMDSGRLLTSQQVKEGTAYKLIITNKSGFYRYRTEDIVTIINASEGAPVITFNCNTGYIRESIGGVALQEYDVYRALHDVEHILKLDIADFAFYPDEELNTWVILIEPSERSLETVKNIAYSDLQSVFNTRLGQIYPAFKSALNAGKVKPCELKFNQPQTHTLYRDVERFRKKISSDQMKPVHFISGDNEVIKKFFLKNLLEF